jgi:endonuclease/exonuclease/phosphatase family metal-dependent hydrolase
MAAPLVVREQPTAAAVAGKFGIGDGSCVTRRVSAVDFHRKVNHDMASSWRPFSALTVFMVLVCFAAVRAEDARPNDDKPVVLATYNINWGNPNLELVAKTIRDSNADLIALQETNAKSEEFLKKELAKVYPQSFFHQGPGASGFGFLSKVPLTNPKYLEPQHGRFGTYFVDAKLAGRSVQFASIHLEPAIPEDGDGFAEMLKLAQRMEKIHGDEIKRIHENLAKDKPVVLMGDFNSISSLSAPRFLKEKGFIDSFASVTENADKHPTWHWKYNGIDWQFRLDHIYHSAALKTEESRIIRAEASDHSMLVSKVRWNDATKADAAKQAETEPQTKEK